MALTSSYRVWPIIHWHSAKYGNPGIINAYENTEKQNWIGSIVTPEANNRLNELGVDLSCWKVAFTKYPVPFKEGEKTFESELFVSIVHHYGSDVKRAVEMMQQEAMNDKDYETKYKVKYDNTLKFIKEKSFVSVSSVAKK